MQQDNLYQKSVTAVFLLMIVGISLFFYSAYLAEQKRSAAIEEINKNNLTALLEQTQATTTDKTMPAIAEQLKSLEEFSENPTIDAAFDPSQSQSSQELENLLKELR